MTAKFEVGKMYRVYGTKLICKITARNDETGKVTAQYCHANGEIYGNKMTRKVKVYGSCSTMTQWESINLDKGFYMKFTTDATREVQ